MHTFTSNRARACLALLALSLSVACEEPSTAGGDAGRTPGDSGIPRDGAIADDARVVSIPTVTSTTPLSGSTDVFLNGNASATFSEPMDRASLNPTTFTLTFGDPAVPVLGTVIYARQTATFWPTEQLSSDTTYTATVTTGALSAEGGALETDHVWSFTTGNTRSPGLPVDLGTAGDFVILAKSAISTVPTSAVTGNIGISPAAATFITGFSLTADATNVFATSPQVTGMVYAADYAVPTPSNLTTAVSDMELAFTDAAARAPDVTELGAGNIGGLTIARGVYKWGTGVLMPTDITLSGSATDVWVFQIAQDLTVSSGAQVHLVGGALPQNVFWQVSGLVDLGTTSHLEGIVLTQTSVTLRTGATVDGRLFAQTAVEIDGSTIVQPAD
ncbi:MAG: ice-binding family protein [Myxococcota bacterium]|nr:ice-binding family protein [Myxococcota bacterium]